LTAAVLVSKADLDSADGGENEGIGFESRVLTGCSEKKGAREVGRSVSWDSKDLRMLSQDLAVGQHGTGQQDVNTHKRRVSPEKHLPRSGR
jgi:hypothetical protein